MFFLFFVSFEVRLRFTDTVELLYETSPFPPRVLVAECVPLPRDTRLGRACLRKAIKIVLETLHHPAF